MKDVVDLGPHRLLQPKDGCHYLVPEKVLEDPDGPRDAHDLRRFASLVVDPDSGRVVKNRWGQATQDEPPESLLNAGDVRWLVETGVCFACGQPGIVASARGSRPLCETCATGAAREIQAKSRRMVEARRVLLLLQGSELDEVVRSVQTRVVAP